MSKRQSEEVEKLEEKGWRQMKNLGVNNVYLYHPRRTGVKTIKK
jgi:hypothetical protein